MAITLMETKAHLMVHYFKSHCSQSDWWQWRQCIEGRSMKNIFRSLLSIVFCSVLACNAAPLSNGRIKVASQGVTDVTAAFGKTQVSVKITTHELEIGKPSDERPTKILSSCTYSRIPCSPIDYLEIFVNGSTLFVARSVYADLADLGEASLHKNKNGQFVLTLIGGDASESYTIDIAFDGSLVRQRTFMSNESAQIMQKTIYFASHSMNH